MTLIVQVCKTLSRIRLIIIGLSSRVLILLSKINLRTASNSQILTIALLKVVKRKRSLKKRRRRAKSPKLTRARSLRYHRLNHLSNPAILL